MEETEDRANEPLVTVDLTAEDALMSPSSALSPAHAAVLGFGRALLRVDEPDVEPALDAVRRAVGARTIVIESFDEGQATRFSAGDAEERAGEHWVPVTVDDAWAGTVSLVLDRSIEPLDRWVLESVADLFEGWIRRQHATQELTRIAEEKDRFVAAVSHEIRTPLSAVLGIAEELRERAGTMDPTEVNQLLGIIAEQSREISDIVEDLLVVARGDRVEFAVRPERVRLDEIVRRAIGSVPASARPGLVMRTVEAVEAMCDPLRTRQVVRNLVVNAHRHGGPHAFIDVVSIPEGDAVIRVADNGDPIPEEVQATMFEPYASSNRADGALSSIGLGLTVCRQLARAMGGDLFYRWDGESRFEVHLPRP